jgi:hypothetical protein
MSENKWVDKIQKILSQASCPGATVSEAETAMGMAQMLMEKHNITQAMLADDKVKQEGDAPILSRQVYSRGKGKMPTWILSLAGGVATANRCKHYYSSSRRHGTITGMGTKDNLTAFELLMPFLVGEIDRLYQEEKPSTLVVAREANRQGLTTRGYGKRWATSFRNGCASRIAQRLREAKRRAAKEMKALAGTSQADLYAKALADGDMDALRELDKAPKADPRFALAKVETALAKLENDFERTKTEYKKIKFRKGSSRNYYGTMSGGFQAGHAAGNRASLNGPKGRIGG